MCILHVYGEMIFFLFENYTLTSFFMISFFMIKAVVPFYPHPNRHPEVSAVLYIQCQGQNLLFLREKLQFIMIYKHIAKYHETSSFQKGPLL